MSISLHDLSGVGDATLQQLAKLHIHTPIDLLFHLPRGYEDRSRVVALHTLRVGQSVLIEGTVQSIDHPAGKKPSLAVQVADGMGRITLRFYQVYAGLKEKFVVGRSVRAFGEVRLGSRGLELYHPDFQMISVGAALPPSRLTAIYPTTEGLTQARLRACVDQVLRRFPANLPELLPEGVSRTYDMQAALRYVHQPPTDANIDELDHGCHPAQQRLIFEELVAHQISLLTRRHFVRAIPAPAFAPSQRLAAGLLAALPFTPTKAQQRVSAEISADLQQATPMLRLVQGDVGSGKTLVAALAACQALEAGWQVALMAPTEILAEQHALNFRQWLAPLGIEVAWLAGKQKGRIRQAAENAVTDGVAHMVVGTHALFQAAVRFHNLGLVIIDEQHRFGVDQRLALREKGALGLAPHQLVMTATPIPRTLAMSAYGDLDTSVIDELPPNRTPITTVTVPFTRRDDVIDRVAINCANGRQAYWVCTLVEQSETLDAQAAEDTHADLVARLPHLKIGLVHGRMKGDEKQRVMAAFKSGELHLLVATTVIEVGVDVPNASLMIIENAERLGLSQLHQLRGRVGRGSTASFCVLMYKAPLSANGIERLTALRDSTDGFVIAEKDLELRGPGELLGTRQTGVLGFRLAQLQRDQHLLPQAQRLAERMLKDYPIHSEALLTRWLPDAPRYAHV
jgi:ATP-dependent DNA helicase RecG